MKPSHRNPLLRNFVLAATICLTLGQAAKAADLFWDANGDASTAVGGTGNWSATAWRTVSTTGTLDIWTDSNRPVFATTLGIITLDQNVAADGMNLTVANNEIRGSGSNAITFSGGTVTTTQAGHEITALLAGSVIFNPTTGNLSGSTSFFLKANNTGLTSFQLNAGGATPANVNMAIDDAGALGLAGSAVTLTNGILNIGALTTDAIGSTAANGSGGGLNLNAWTTTLAGSTIRSRAGANTWNGPTTLTANSGLMTRAAAGVSLTFSNTATIDLGSFTLTSSSDLTASGIKLQGNIIGTGGKIATGNFNGGGTLNAGGYTVLSGSNSYTGGTDVNFGSLVFLKAASKPSTGTINVAAGATLGLGVGTALDGYFTAADISALFAGTFGATLNTTSNVGLDTTAGDFIYGGSSGAVTYGLSKLGANKLTLTGANAYTGPTNVFGGTLALSGSGTFGSGALTLNGGTVDLGGQSINIGALSVALPATSGETITAGSLTTSGTTATAYAVSNATGNAVIAASLLANSTAGLTKSGAGTLTLSGSNTYTGGTTVSAGSITFLKTASLPATGTVTVPATSTVGLGVGTSPTYFSGTDVVSLLAGTLTNVPGTNAYTVGINTSAGDFNLTNDIGTSTRAIIKQGANALTLSGNNTYDKLVTVSEGTLKAGSATAFNNTGTITVLAGATLDLNGFDAKFTNMTSSTGTVTTTGAGSGTDTLTISALSATSANLFTDNGTRKLSVSVAGSNISPLNNIGNTFSGGLILGNALRITPGAPADTSGSPGAIVSGPFGRGAITLNGGTTFNAAAQIMFGASNRTLVNDVIVNATGGNGNRGGSFRIGTNVGTLAGLEISGNITANTTEASFGSDSGEGTTLLLSGRLTGPNGFRFFQSANAWNWVATLNNATVNPNDYAGNTTIANSQTTVRLGAANQIPNGTGKGNVAVSFGTLDLAGFSETINGLTGAGTVDNVATGISNTLTLGDGDATGTIFTGAIKDTTGTLSLTKIGTGIQTLSGASNNYSGATTVSNGTLKLGHASAIATSPTITVDSGAFLDVSTVAWSLGAAQTLKGNGTVTGSTTLAGTVAPGTSVGTLNVGITAGTTALTGTYACDVVSATTDQLAVTGDLNITGANFTVNTVTPTPGTYTIATYSGTLTGTFTPSPALPSGYVLDYATTGQIKLTVPNTATPYETWGSAYGLTAGSEGGDLDKDGLTNFQEFAFGLIPNSGSSVNPITVQLSKTTGQFTYQRLAASGLTYTIWTSTDLATWTQDSGAVQNATPAGANESVQVTLSASAPLAATKLFVRVKAN